jgi:hypothetical protein
VWEFDRNRTTTVEVASNVIVDGTLRMRPSSPRIVHTLRFVGIDEAEFIGGGMEPIPSDVGLWVRGSGKLDLAGSSKQAWLRAAEPLSSGSSSFTVDDVPLGWRIGDEIAITPTISPGSTSHDAYDVATISAISGRSITVATRTNHPHPAVEISPSRTMYAEVLNPRVTSVSKDTRRQVARLHPL